MDVLVTIAVLAVVFWGVALAAVSFANALVKLLSDLGESGAIEKPLSLLRYIFHPANNRNIKAGNSSRGLLRGEKKRGESNRVANIDQVRRSSISATRP